jgi:ATP-binding cassette subfamily B protein
VGIAVLVPPLVTGSATPSALALGFVGVLLVYRTLRALVTGLVDLSGAAVAWRRVSLLSEAAARPESAGVPSVSLGAPQRSESAAPVLDARDLVYRYGSRSTPALRGVSLRIQAGERLLLEGSSGGGKSTLGAVLAGLREPESGLLLADGLDIQSLGLHGWRRKVVSAPQFHENHIFSGTLAFNLLMGRRWPAEREDIQDAIRTCRALGLTDVILRMPNRLQQHVGETGWRLSHGEQSRVFIARALLQGAEVVILDESLGALDPETHGEVMRCVLDSAPTLILIAHP